MLQYLQYCKFFYKLIVNFFAIFWGTCNTLMIRWMTLHSTLSIFVTYGHAPHKKKPGPSFSKGVQRYPPDKSLFSGLITISFANTCRLDRDLSAGQRYPAFQQLVWDKNSVDTPQTFSLADILGQSTCNTSLCWVTQQTLTVTSTSPQLQCMSFCRISWVSLTNAN